MLTFRQNADGTFNGTLPAAVRVIQKSNLVQDAFFIQEDFTLTTDRGDEFPGQAGQYLITGERLPISPDDYAARYERIGSHFGPMIPCPRCKSSLNVNVLVSRSDAGWELDSDGTLATVCGSTKCLGTKTITLLGPEPEEHLAA